MAEGDPALDSVPFQEAIDFLRQKVNVPSPVWADILGAAHARAFTVTLSGSSQWDNVGDAASDPVAQILDIKETVRSQTGQYPNVITFGPLAWIAFKRHPIVRAQYQYTTAKVPTVDMVAELLEVEKVVVGRAVTASDANDLSDVWGDNVVMSYSPQELSAAEEPSFGYTYVFAGTPYAEVPYWDPRAKAWVFGVTMDRIPVLTGISSGYLIVNPSGASE